MSMILRPGGEPRRIEIAEGVVFVCLPMTTTVALAGASARHAWLEAHPDDQEGAEVAFTRVVAQRTIVDWTGIVDADGADLPVTPEAVSALVDLPMIYTEIKRQVVTPGLILEHRKNA